MLTDLTSNAWPQTPRGSLVLPGDHTVFSWFNQATLINVCFRLHFLPSIFQQLLSHTCFQREHSQASTRIPLSSCTHVTCLPAHIKNEPFIHLGKSASLLSHTITRMTIPSVIIPSVIPRSLLHRHVLPLHWIFSITMQTCYYFSHIKKKTLSWPHCSISFFWIHSNQTSHFSTESPFVKVTSDLHLLNYICQFSVLIILDLSTAKGFFYLSSKTHTPLVLLRPSIPSQPTLLISPHLPAF